MQISNTQNRLRTTAKGCVLKCKLSSEEGRREENRCYFKGGVGTGLGELKAMGSARRGERNHLPGNQCGSKEKQSSPV